MGKCPLTRLLFYVSDLGISPSHHNGGWKIFGPVETLQIEAIEPPDPSAVHLIQVHVNELNNNVCGFGLRPCCMSSNHPMQEWRGSVDKSVWLSMWVL